MDTDRIATAVLDAVFKIVDILKSDEEVAVDTPCPAIEPRRELPDDEERVMEARD